MPSRIELMHRIAELDKELSTAHAQTSMQRQGMLAQCNAILAGADQADEPVIQHAVHCLMRKYHLLSAPVPPEVGSARTRGRCGPSKVHILHRLNY